MAGYQVALQNKVTGYTFVLRIDGFNDADVQKRAEEGYGDKYNILKIERYKGG